MTYLHKNISVIYEGDDHTLMSFIELMVALEKGKVKQ